MPGKKGKVKKRKEDRDIMLWKINNEEKKETNCNSLTFKHIMQMNQKTFRKSPRIIPG